ncbi:MAG: cytochrome b/b6 domain-containing protein [Gammaproteobacteria bacterium]|nr:cytochrome b/b6 domain-containing protein [Gammaproteobacteria bacterium]
MKNAHTEASDRVAVWDIFIRIFHWSLIPLIAFAWFSGDRGGRWLAYHMWDGYVTLALIAFRILWGFIGSTTARFAHFLTSPRRTLAYVRTMRSGASHAHHGHNPLGGWAVGAMLTCLSIQVGTGLFATDDILTTGPLNALVSGRTADLLTHIHAVTFDILLGLIGLHVSAIIVHRIAGKDLVTPMITGWMRTPREVRPPFFRRAHPWVSAAAILLSALITYVIVQV